MNKGTLESLCCSFLILLRYIDFLKKKKNLKKPFPLSFFPQKEKRLNYNTDIIFFVFKKTQFKLALLIFVSCIKNNKNF